MTYITPNPIIQLRYIFCFLSIFKFQNKEVGYKARMTSTAETIASKESVKIISIISYLVSHSLE